MEICQIVYPYLIVLKLSWCLKGLNFTNAINIFNHKFFYRKILKILYITYMQNKQKKLKANTMYTQYIPYTGC